MQKPARTLKVLLIRRPGIDSSPLLHFYLASAGISGQLVYHFPFENYQELLDLDFSSILQNPVLFHPQLVSQPLLLVCTNGRRDPCCASKGVSVYHALWNAIAGAPTDQHVSGVWQCSHIGGHRFAANLIVLPHGLLYGRVDPEGALQIYEYARLNRIYLPLLRGRTAYPPAVQAAEAHLLWTTGQTELDSFRLLSADVQDDGTWIVAFESCPEGSIHHLSVSAKAIEQPVFESCQLDKTAAAVEYHASIL